MEALNPNRRRKMRKLLLGAIAAVTLFTAAVPAMAQVGFYVGPGGVRIGAPYHHRYYDYYGRPGFYHGYGAYHRWRHWRHW
jgi:hypothetical protein